jgi:hypothetical protein
MRQTVERVIEFIRRYPLSEQVDSRGAGPVVPFCLTEAALQSEFGQKIIWKLQTFVTEREK